MKTFTIDDIRKAVEHNSEHGLYASDPNFIRVYFTYDGGKYNGQRDDVKSAYYLQKLEAYEGDIKDIELITTSAATSEFLNNLVKEA
jgi:hypothetical protein